MNQTTKYALLILCTFLLLVGTSHWLHTIYKASIDASRKFLHVTGGLLALAMPLVLPGHWWVFLLCLLAFLLLLVTYLMNILKAVHGTKRKSIGSVIFPVAVYICFLFAEKWNSFFLFYLPISLLTVADPMAEWGGKKWGHLSISFFNRQKTLSGSLCFAFTALILSFTISIIYKKTSAQILLICFAITLISTLAELITLKGWDNLSIPLVSLGFLLMMV